MPESIYVAITAFASGGTLCFGLCFLFLCIPESPFLKGYRTARRMMALAYLGLSLLYIMEIIFNHPGGNILLTRSIKLTVGSFQALLFTHTFISLVNTSFATRKRLVWELIPIVGFALAIFITGPIGGNIIAFNISYYLFILYYLSMLIRYLILFLREYKACVQRADNYYADEEALRVRWIYYSFWGIFMIGVLLLPLLFSGDRFYYSLFTLFFIVLYSYFGIGFIEYAFRYKSLEPLALIPKEEKTLMESNKDKMAQSEHIKKALDAWVNEEKFLKQGLTIEMVAMELNTNRTYLSNYFNQIEQQTFRLWINFLKIDKAKKLLLKHPDMLVVEIAGLSGYSDSSNFNKQFVKSTGISAQTWRKQNLAKKTYSHSYQKQHV